MPTDVIVYDAPVIGVFKKDIFHLNFVLFIKNASTTVHAETSESYLCKLPDEAKIIGHSGNILDTQLNMKFQRIHNPDRKNKFWWVKKKYVLVWKTVRI